MSRDRVEEADRFHQRYAVSGMAALLAAEAEALGTDYQANGYTTLGQADELGRLLALEPGKILLDLGAGCGWPGLYLAAKHGCSVIGLDPIAEGVDVARRRAVTDGLEHRGWAVLGNAERIPLRSRTVDAIVHTDLMC